MVESHVHILLPQWISMPCRPSGVGGTAAAVPPPFRLGNPALCGSRPLKGGVHLPHIGLWARRWIDPLSGKCDARPTVTFPAAEHHRPLAGTKLYCLVTKAHGCEQLAQSCYPAMHRAQVEPATSRSQVQHPTTTPPSHPSNLLLLLIIIILTLIVNRDNLRNSITLDIQRVMTIVTSVRKVEQVFQLSFLPLRTTKLMDETRDMTQHVVHRHVDSVAVQGTGRFRQTNAEPRTPQLAHTIAITLPPSA